MLMLPGKRNGIHQKYNKTFAWLHPFFLNKTINLINEYMKEDPVNDCKWILFLTVVSTSTAPLVWITKEANPWSHQFPSACRISWVDGKNYILLSCYNPRNGRWAKLQDNVIILLLSPDENVGSWKIRVSPAAWISTIYYVWRVRSRLQSRTESKRSRGKPLWD